MKRALIGILVALTILGTAAGLSGRQIANEELQDIKSRWAELQSQPPAQRTPDEVAELREKAEGLATRYPDREEIRIWERIIERSSRDWRSYGRHTS